VALEDAFDIKFDDLKFVLVQKLFSIVGGKTRCRYCCFRFKRRMAE